MTSLLDRLGQIDVSGVVSARGSISGAIGAEDVQAIVGGGAAQAALGDLGAALGRAQSVDGPEALLRPLADALGGLTGIADTSGLPLAEYLDDVVAGIGLLGRAFGDGEDGSLVARLAGAALTEAGRVLPEALGGFADVAAPDLARFRRLVDAVEAPGTADPAALAELLLSATAPVPVADLRRVRAGVDAVLGAADDLGLPATRGRGLVLAFDGVAFAAARADAGALEAALRDLEAARRTTLDALRADVAGLLRRLDALPVADVLEVVADARVGLATAQEGVLEVLGAFREQIVAARAQVEAFDLSEGLALLHPALDEIERHVDREMTERVEQEARRLEDWVRGLLRELRLRELRAELSRFLHDVAEAVDGLGLRDAAEEARGALRAVAEGVGAADLGDRVRGAVEDAAAVLDRTVGSLTDALGEVREAIEAVTGEGVAALEELATQLEAFRGTLDAAVAEIEGLGIEAAGEEVVQRLTALRETAEQVLGHVPLPEALRPTVEELIGVLDDLDVEGELRPAFEQAAARLEVPEEVATTIRAGLERARDVLDGLVPAQLVESIRAEVTEALDALRGFDPATLLPGVSELVDQAADAIEALDPTALGADLRAPVQAALDAIDAAAPHRLLAPVIAAYERALDGITVPTPTAAPEELAAAMNTAGDAVGRALMEPVRRIAPEGTGLAAAGEGGDPPPAGVSADDPVRPGDLVRLLGYLPARLHEALVALGDGPVGEVLAEVDRLTLGLARELRRIPEALLALDRSLDDALHALLAPVAEAQLRAQVAVHAAVEAGELRVDGDRVSVRLTAAGAAGLRLEVAPDLARAGGAAREQAAVAAGAGAPLARTAAALEGFRLSGVLSDAEALLAALDPEPLAAEVDALVGAVATRAPALLGELQDELTALVDRVVAMVRRLDPSAYAQRYLRVLTVVREELDVLDPRRLADELSEVHAAVRASVAAYDPALFAAELGEVVRAAATELRALDPATLLGDLGLFEDIADRIAALDPSAALEDVGAALDAVGERLAALDPTELITTVNELPDRVLDALLDVAGAVQREVLALLEALRFATQGGSVSVSGSVSL